MEKEGKSDGDNGSTIKVNVKFNGRSIPVEISDESTVKHLKSVLQPLTNDGPIRKEASTLPTVRRMPEAMKPKRDVPQVPVVKSQLERWKATGVVALSECNLKIFDSPTKNMLDHPPNPNGKVDLSSNLLVELPETISKLKDLKLEGWENFDERRRSKHQKQLDFRVNSSAKFDEGADKS
ncbi:hypothetical protein RND71_018953 [Anisodus tanguticus]|uniref:Uncharacterized protein n=1 Tax=Anisodus tanguticus TaxID=243964 RepID=A0AAE1VCI3_9SOLA|nr:hypothetical protein RND71_018953 [Anisodus tanguticus]